MLFSLIIGSFALPAFAARDDTVAEKAALYGVYKTCYKENNMITPVRSDDFSDIWSIARDEGSFTLPTGWYNEYSASCLQLIQNTYASADFKGIATMEGIAIPNSSSGASTINTFLSGMGYRRTAGASGQCATYTYNSEENGSGTNQTITMCAGVDSQGRITDDQVQVTYSENGSAVVQFEIDTPGEVDLDCSQVFAHGSCNTHRFIKGETLFSDLVGEIYGDLQANRSEALCGPTGCGYYLQNGAPITNRAGVQASFSIDAGNSGAAGDKAVKYLSKDTYSNHNGLRLTKDERIQLLQDYLQNYYRVNIYGCNIRGNDVSVAESAGYTKTTTNLSSGGGFQECWVKPTQNAGNSVAGYGGSHFFDGTMMDFTTVAHALSDAATGEDRDTSVVPPSEGGTVTPSEGVDDETENPCSTAASSLGWIICPVLQVVGSAANGIYEYIENSFLQTNANFLRSNDNNGTYAAWSTFQSIANIAFAIVLLVIILSQITGFGVSNYGIKKMLPSLIIVAILVNISFFLCQIAVDLSNIVGLGVKQTFANLGANSSEFGDGSLASIVGNPDGDLGIVPTLLTGVAGTAAAAALIATRGVWIWPFLLVLLGAVIAVIFFFILLGVRQAGIIVLVALAPVAIVCYALPNTKKIYERWWKLFFGLLIVYPICGALMGGGQFASRLLLVNTENGGDGSFFYALVAMLVQVVPFFFVPSIVRSSFAAMGNLGTKLSNFGRGISRGATGAIRRSDAYKDRLARGRVADAERGLARSASTRGLWGLSNRVGARIRSGNNRVSRAAQGAYERRQAQRINAIAAQGMADQNARFTTERGMEAAERRMNASMANTMVKNYEEEFSNDLEFTNDPDRQASEYNDAVNAIIANPTDQDSIARLRAMQNVLSKSDRGRRIIENTIDQHLYDEQEAAIAAGRTATVSDGLRTVGQTLMNDHTAFKNTSRGFYNTIGDMNSATNASRVFEHGTFARDEIRNERGIVTGYNYHNSNYDAMSSGSSAADLGGADERTLQNLTSSVATMNDEQLADVYRSASEAITNGNISVKPENEAMLNQIRQEAWGQMQANSASSGAYYDDQGRRFDHNVGSFYNYTDNDGNVHRYKRDGNGNFQEMGGTEVIASDHMINASDNFTFQYGNAYRELHAGDSYKIEHRKQEEYTAMPYGWHQRNDGSWYNGNTKLNPADAALAQRIQDHNNDIKIKNGDI